MNETTQHETLQIKKIFWSWEDDKEEAWLREQARQGRHLVKADWGMYTFETGAPRDMVYRLDYTNARDPKQIEEYVQFFQDAGWEQVGELLGWRYFRKPYRPGEQDEIYSDPESKIQKYKRLLYLVVAVLPLSIFPILNLPLFSGPLARTAVSWVVASLIAVIVLAEVYIIARLLLRIQQLKRL